MDLNNNNQGRYQPHHRESNQEIRPIGSVREQQNKHTAHQVLAGMASTTPGQKSVVTDQNQHVSVRQFNAALAQKPSHMVISDDSDTSSLSSSSGSMVSGTVTGSDMDSSMT